MANPVRQIISSVTTGPIIGLDWWQSPFNVSIGVDVSNAVGATFGLQYTLSDFNNVVVTTPPASTIVPLWRADTNIPAGSTTSLVSNYQFPIFGIRLVVTTLTSGYIVLEVLQGMNAQY